MATTDPKPFVFNKSLDVGFLTELFENDMQFAATVFEDFLQNFPQFEEEVNTAYNAQNILALRSAFHKCKPLFGYVGFTSVQLLIQEFENKCLMVNTIAELNGSYTFLQEIIKNAHSLIEEEYERLKEFNGSIHG